MEVLKKTNPQDDNNYNKRASKIAQKSYKIVARRGPGGSWGRFWDHFGPQRSRVEKATKRGLRRPPPRDSFWGPLGDLGRHRADIFFVFGCRVGNLCDDRRFDGQNVLHKRSPRSPQTMKPMVSPTRNHWFHFSTCTSKMTENGLQWVPLWDTFRSFWAPKVPQSRKKRPREGHLGG